MNGVGAALSNMESSMKKVSFSRSPLKDLDGSRSRSSSSSSQTRGCLGFFSSKIPHHHHHHHRRHRTPKSAPNPTRVPKQLKPPPLLKSKEKKKKKKKKMMIHICSSRMANMGSDGESLQKIKMDQAEEEEEEEEEEKENSNNFTRTHTRTPPGKDAITPPIQASISPEIQIGGCSSTATATATATYSCMISTTPAACFGAGHLLSGVTDKRKCRPRGILAVPHHQDHNNLGLFSTPPSATADNSSSVPSPAQASMHWLLSPPSPLNPYQEEENPRESFSCDSNFSSHNLISTPPSHYYYSSSENSLPFSCFNTGEAPLVDVLPLPTFSFHLSDSTTGPLSNDGTHSWREGLASRMFEMDDDEFDCCQWLSEDEKDHFMCNFDSDPMVPRSASKKPIELQEKKAPINPCAESITTDGGGLLVASSTDSDWTLSYKNNLFKS
ncbi:hypothetical protein Syun_005721 [Stephania yunnanensis]|uniref:Uncharacterized protein n=1 Tax=Stephania yunnanensis TaxID=152371 RepID=A0AAP0KWB3_9MAGN